MMKIPPIDWEDLIQLGVDRNAVISFDQYSYVIEPKPSKLVQQLLSTLIINPVPDSNNRLIYLRHIRDILISLTDWTQTIDSPMDTEQRTAWANYRRILRDLPNNYGGTGSIPWPIEPS